MKKRRRNLLLSYNLISIIKLIRGDVSKKSI